jgi:RsiW-degrading membrane proteinase PrsW (M82 family)
MTEFLLVFLSNIVLCALVSLYVARDEKKREPTLLVGGLLVGGLFGLWNGIFVGFFL